MNGGDSSELIDILRSIGKAIESLPRPEEINGPGVGVNVLKSAKSTLICKTCHKQVEISEICKNKVPKYKCPECGLERKIGTTAIWIEYEQVFNYRKVKVF